MILPSKIKSVFTVTKEKKHTQNIVTGRLICGSSNIFKVSYTGVLKKNIFGAMHIESSSNGLVFNVKCVDCNNSISIFNSNTDGYDNCFVTKSINIDADSLLMNPFYCNKCNNNVFEVEITYEYPSLEDLEELKIKDNGNAFTWIWISLKCAKCKRVYKNLIDYETG